MTRRSWLALVIVLLALANGATSYAARRFDTPDQIAQVFDDEVAPCVVVAPPQVPLRVDVVVDMLEPVAPAIVDRAVLVLAPKTSPPQKP